MSVGEIGQKSHMTGALDGDGQLSLMSGAGAGNASRQDLRSLRGVVQQSLGVLVVDLVDAVRAERTDLLPSGAVGSLGHSLAGSGLGSFGAGGRRGGRSRGSGLFNDHFGLFGIHLTRSLLLS